MQKTDVTIIGSGAYGTALSIRFSLNGLKISLWGRDKKNLIQMNKNRIYKKFSSNIKFPNNLIIEPSLKKAIKSSKNILIAIPSFGFNKILHNIKPYLNKNSRIIWATKGLEKQTGRLLQDVAIEILGKQIPLAILSGPSFANEIAIGLLTSVNITSNNKKFLNELQKLFNNKANFRVYKNSDMIGIQLCVILKNIIAIASGISDGIGLGENAKAAIITNGLSEIIKLGTSMGASLSTFIGLSGIGDLVLTCTSNQSRNRKFGILIGKGIKIEKAKKQINNTIEGILNIKEIYRLSKKLNVDMPITKQIYKILFHNKNIIEATNLFF